MNLPRKVVLYGILLIWAVIAAGIIVRICWNRPEYRMIQRTEPVEVVGIVRDAAEIEESDEETTPTAPETGDVAAEIAAESEICCETAAEPDDGRDIPYDPTAACWEEPLTVNSRYSCLTLSDDDLDLLAAIVYLEAHTEPAECRQAVAEVILNRMASDRWPDTMEGVIFEAGQFTTAAYVDTADPTGDEYGAIEAALYGEPITPADVVYFSLGGENSRVWKTLGKTIFCREYEWR